MKYVKNFNQINEGTSVNSKNLEEILSYIHREFNYIIPNDYVSLLDYISPSDIVKILDKLSTIFEIPSMTNHIVKNIMDIKYLVRDLLVAKSSTV